MKRIVLIAFLALMAILFNACSSGPTYVVIETEFGDMKAELYDSTPKHKENFIKLVKEGFYDDLLFHRVMSGFMAQGGDPQSKGAAPGVQLGAGSPGYTLEAEIGAPHFKGALAAARQGDAFNPEKRSNGSQFYVVQGTPQSDAQINSWEKRKGIQYNEAQKEKYRTIGGRPDLDLEYTVFGEVVEGIEVIDKLCSVQTDPRNRPVQDIKMKVRIAN
ncbi:MAG: peptidylprolyl isomerase [Saprospiraceae bacterium]|nr:peptidylprolyl isomerase [Saprospiraceae bacterium]